MLTTYLCFLAGGTVLPFVSFLMGFLSGGFDTDLDTDIDVDTDINPDINLTPDSLADTHVITDSTTEFNMEHDIHISTDMNSGTGADSFLSIGLIPSSFLAVSALGITFGATGALMTIGNFGKLLTFIIALVIGYLASVVVQTIMKTLKKVQVTNSGIAENELLLYDGKVIDTILPGQMGTVSFVTLKKERVSYPAKCEDKNLKLETGRIVKVIEFKNGIFIVEPKNKYE